ncbi:MAG: hypothetical protein K0R75_2169 [Paenibacillaceae bacterium]|nr:hypothetical protein [Paenibacillaceae bacterium]
MEMPAHLQFFLRWFPFTHFRIGSEQAASHFPTEFSGLSPHLQQEHLQSEQLVDSSGLHLEVQLRQLSDHVA